MANGNIDKYKFEDLFDMDKVQKLTDSIAEALGLGIVIVSPEGVPITRPSNFCSFCLDVVRSSEIGNRNCIYSDSVLGRKSDKPIMAKCLSAGLVDAGISIIINGKHLASWMVGQVMLEEELLSDADQRERAHMLGIDETLFLNEIQSVTRMTREQFHKILEMIRVLAMQLSELGMQSYIQQEELTYIKEVETELRSENKKLEQSHNIDELTGLYTKACFDEKLQELINAKAYPIVLVSGDMNNLKLNNDVFGHQTGDVAIRAVGSILREQAGANYLVGRRSGDEFLVAMPRGSKEEAEDYCRRIHVACADVTETIVPPSVSLGYAVLYSDADEPKFVKKQAEDAMYSAKVQKKRTHNINEDIMEVLFERQYLLRKQVEATITRIGRFARYLKLEEHTIKVLKLSAKLQDIGLIAVPEKIVKKRGEYTEEEYAELAKHTLIGYRLVRLYEESFTTANTILQSHECWSGQGYPNRIKEKEILYTSRILHIVSSYSDWIYRDTTDAEVSGVEVARKRLLEEAGRQFDPELVHLFLQYLEREETVDVR